ncbi:ComEC/Rec2 family competence protein [Methylobacterium planeticum]|uniref:ComEC family competence protein n=1 Tax=Methylobacterium planeticum TaxID=2615211 RepID=A0A6N6MVE1_9HYPH|nr:ComEC/Rec2 family competence protein [Methylobacterium planeticum]KAB1076055.1 ComEC family competence protein [Methylobacterium planeticum]
MNELRTGLTERALAVFAPVRGPALHAWIPATGAFIKRELALEAEQRRLFPWLAVAFGGGILVFFTVTDGMPNLWAPVAGAGIGLTLAAYLGAYPVNRAVLLVLAAACLGFAAGTWRVAQMAGPILSRTSIAPLTGFIEALDERDEGARLIVRVTRFGTLGESERPSRVRVSYRKPQTLRPGDFIAATARLLPPPEAARPGGYDFARDAFFRGIGAVGSLTGKIEVRPPPGPIPLSLRLAAAIDDARNGLTRRITDANGGQAGAVAAALVTGKRGLIAQETNDILRAAGIYHVVSISGLHMVLAAGVVFWLLRALLALLPSFALHLPIKKLAAGVAMIGVTAYCAFSGWDIAAERSLIMTLIMLGAILVDRPALSMRNLALAALVALAREPEGVLGPSFQMSFGAVAGLIACARWLDGRLLRREGSGWLVRGVAFVTSAVIATLLTTLVAQVATAPFATYHFQTIQPFGLVGNALTLPLVSLAVMPAAVIGILAYPFALDLPIWWMMGLAVRGMLSISGWIAGFGQANIVVPAFGAGAMGLLACGLLLATLPISRLRWLAVPPTFLGLGFAAIPERHDIFVDRDGQGAAVRSRSGRLVALGKPSDFVLEQWLKADGDNRKPAALADGASCDRLGCTVEAFDGRKVSWVRDKRAFSEDCARADVLITARIAPAGCPAALVIDRAHLGRHGATALRLTADGAVLSHARSEQRVPPWRAKAHTDINVPSSSVPLIQEAPQPDAEVSEDTDPARETRPQNLQ